MSLNGMWIDPADDDFVTVAGGSPEAVVVSIADKSDSGNDVSTLLPSLLLNFDGVDGATSFTSQDLGSRALTFTGNAQLDTALKSFGTASLLLDGTGDWVTVPLSSPESITLGTGDFTIELWFYRNTAFVSFDTLFDWRNSNSDPRPYIGFVSGVLTFSTDATRISGSSPSTGTWHHVAVVRRDGITRMYFNGVDEGTDYTDATNYSDNRIRLGADWSNGSNWNGNIDDVRIIVGTAVYSADFTPPIRANAMPPTASFDEDGRRLLSFDGGSLLSATPPVPSLLCNFEGQDGRAGSPEYISEDSNAQVATFVSNAVLDDAQAKFGTTSLLVKGTADGVTFPDSDIYKFRGEDFTIEMWVRFDASPTANKMFIGQWVTTGSQLSWVWLIVAGNLRFDRSTNGSGQATMVSHSFAPSAGQWYHLAIVRRGGEMEQWIDGISQGTSSTIGTDVLHDSTGDVEIGWYVAGSFGHDGWLDDIRVVKGEAIYPTGNFVPPTKPHTLDSPRDMEGPDFTAIAAISDNNRAVSELLIDWDTDGGSPDGQQTYTTDDAIGRTVTFGSGAALDTAIKRFGNASLLLGGTGDHVTIPSAADLALGTGDFTIEFWIYPTSVTSTRIIYDQRSAATSDFPAIYMSVGELRYYVDGADRITGSTLTTGSWYHVMLVRKDGVTRMYLDGVQDGSDWTDSTDYLQNTLTIGQPGYTTGNEFIGNIDGVRVVVGLALPPTIPVFGMSGDASPLDESGWRMNRSAMSVLAPSVGDEETNVAPVDTAVNGDMIVSMTRDSVGEYIVGHADGIPGAAVAYSGVLGFSQDMLLGEFPGDIMELVYVDRDLRTDERQRVEGYLAHKWAILESLPEQHPFFSQAPDIVRDSAFIANFNGVDGDTSYTSDDAGARVATFNGTAQLDDAQQKFGAVESPIGTSAFFDGNSDYIDFPDSSDYELGAGDFTIEAWIRFSTDPAATNEVWMSHWTQTGNHRSWHFSVLNNQLSLGQSTSGTAADNTFQVAWNPVVDQWYHVAASRIGNILRFFVDGVQTGADVDVSGISFFAPTSPLTFGRINEAAPEYFTGNIDSARITVGEGLYKYDFTPPTRGFVLPTPAALLANFNGPDGIASPPGYTSEDVNAWVPTFTGNAQLDTAQKKFGISSLLLDGSGDWVTFASDPVFDFGLDDFTVEFWMRPTSTATANIFSWGSGVQGAIYFDSTQLKFQFSGTARINGGTIGTGAWIHIALSRIDGVFEMFTDGVSDGTYSAATANFDQATIEVGRRVGSANVYNGHIDGVRVVHGVGLYASTALSPAGFIVPFDAPGEPIV